MDDMRTEEEIDPHNSPPGLEKRHSDVSRRTFSTATYPQIAAGGTQLFVDPTALSQSLEACLAVQDLTPSSTTIDYNHDDPFSAQLFSAASTNTFLQLDGAIPTRFLNDLSSVPANHFGSQFEGTVVAPPQPPVTPPPPFDYSLRNTPSHLSYAQRSGDNFESCAALVLSDKTPRSSAESHSPLQSASPLTCPVNCPVTCSICHTPFSGEYAPGNLKRHLRSSHTNTKIICEAEKCDKAFNRSDARRSHYKKHHPELL